MDFAYSELTKYITIITGSPSHGIRLGINDKISEGGTDAYDINVVGGYGAVTGANELSVLLGVYAFLRELGCRFFYPDKRLENIVKLPLSDCTVKLSRQYELNHRGLVIEGSVGEEHVIAAVDWCVKNGLNSYFIQFKNSYEFFERWYKHDGNPYKSSEAFDNDRANEICNRIVAEIKKRGMRLHSVGHGWICDAMGIFPRGWYTCENALDGEVKNLIASVGGKREFFQAVPLNTNLCYSDKRARELVVNAVVNYAESHTETDYLHFWLADSYNNFCECEECKKSTPSDLYVKLLNELDEKLTLKKINVKIVFLIYFDLLLPPKRERIKNPDRFVLMFAPATRDYENSLKTGLDVPPEQYPADFAPNKNNFKSGVKANVGYLKSWQAVFGGDSFIFDYPLMWEIYNELTGLKLAETIAEDIENLKPLKLNGYMSCQVQRNFFPTGLPMYVIARKSEDPSISYEAIKSDYFGKTLGKNWRKAYNELKELSDTPVTDYLRKKEVDKQNVKAYAAELIKKLDARVKRYRNKKYQASVSRGYDKLILFYEFYVKLCELIVMKLNGGGDTDSFMENFKKWIYAYEDEYVNEMDCSYYVIRMKNVIDL